MPWSIKPEGKTLNPGKFHRTFKQDPNVNEG